MNKTKFLLIAEIITVSIFIVAIFTGNSFFISASFAATICFLGLLLGQRVKSKQQIIISTKKGIVISITCVLTIVIDMIILLFTKEYMTAIICISLITSITGIGACYYIVKY